MTRVPPQPFTSTAPDIGAVFVPAMSSATSASNPAPSRALSSKPGPTPTPLPIREKGDQEPIPSAEVTTSDDRLSKDKPGEFPLPKLRLEIRDLTHPGAVRFLSVLNPSLIFADAVRDVLRLLYVSPAQPDTYAPPTRSVTLILRDLDGVAYTTGSDLDSDHKEIHFSLGYIASAAQGKDSEARGRHEFQGVLTHELVHCYQWTGKGHCPGGLIEGIADWVRLNCDLGPPHWKKEVEGDWDRGYQHTAYFLQYLEERYGKGTVRRLNEKLRAQKYEEKSFWTELLGRPVKQLYEDYVGAETKSTSENDATK